MWSTSMLLGLKLSMSKGSPQMPHSPRSRRNSASNSRSRRPRSRFRGVGGGGGSGLAGRGATWGAGFGFGAGDGDGERLGLLAGSGFGGPATDRKILTGSSSNQKSIAKKRYPNQMPIGIRATIPSAPITSSPTGTLSNTGTAPTCDRWTSDLLPQRGVPSGLRRGRQVTQSRVVVPAAYPPMCYDAPETGPVVSTPSKSRSADPACGTMPVTQAPLC